MTTLTGLTVQTPSGAVYVPRFGLAIEHAIVRALILEMVKAGWAPREVWCDGEQMSEPGYLTLPENDGAHFQC